VKQTLGLDQITIRYLLNELSAKDQALFEEAYISDESLFEQVQALEEELIEDYVRGNLSARRRRRFERHYLASIQRRSRIEATRQLVRACSLESPARAAVEGRMDGEFFSSRPILMSIASWRLAPVFGVAAVLLALLSAGLFTKWLRQTGQFPTVGEEGAAVVRKAEEPERRLVPEPEQSAGPRARGPSPQVKSGRERPSPQASKNQIVFLALTAGRRDGNKTDSAVISTRTNFVELRVELDRQEAANLRSYRVGVKTVDEDREIWAQDGVKPRRRQSLRYLLVRVPADRFKTAEAQDFMLTLGAMTVGGKDYEDSYYFHLTSR